MVSEERFRKIENLLEEAAGTPLWLRQNYTEPRVKYAMCDLVKPGWVAYDVGANFGGLTVTLSRLVGPRGIVCSFEANPVIAARCQREMLRSGAYNSQLFHGAIYKTSGENIELYISDNAVADSIYRKTDKSIRVQTIALDDFVQRTELSPKFIKMDIEGAEADALVGFEKTIDASKPIFILEHTPPDNTCFEFLKNKGYVAIDLQDYRRLSSPDDVLPGTAVTDVLYAQESDLVGTAYENEIEGREFVTVTGDDFSWLNDRYLKSKTLDLPAGRYLLDVDFEATGNSNTMCGICYDHDLNEQVMRCHASSSALVHFARNMVLDTDGRPVHFFYSFQDHADESLAIKTIKIKAVESFTRYRTPFSFAH